MATATRDVQAALVNLFTSALRGDGVEVHDGPRVRGKQPSQYVLVGVNGLEEDGAGLRSVQGPSAMQGDWRDEAGEIDCTVVTWSGKADIPALRVKSDSAIATCEAAINADPQLGGLIKPANNFAHLTALDTREAQTDRGPFVEAVFTISYTTILT